MNMYKSRQPPTANESKSLAVFGHPQKRANLPDFSSYGAVRQPDTRKGIPIPCEEAKMSNPKIIGATLRVSNENEISLLKDQIAGFTTTLLVFARRFVRTDQDAEDLVQEAIFRALRSAHLFTPGTSLKSWLFTILRNSFCSRYKVAKREHVGLPLSVHQCMTTTPEQEWKLEHDQVMLAIRDLDVRQRQALMLVAEGTSYAAAAEICGCKIGTIKSRVNRARETLKRDLY
jgi:RNA polymerase sigma-70 factor (ECF subfamily)